MTETEWNLKRENARLKMALAEANAQVCQINFTQAKAELDALGETFQPTTKGNGHGRLEAQRSETPAP
jgi:hypothetical protein